MLLWVWVVIVAIVMATVTGLAAKLTLNRPTGPAHVLTIPDSIGTFTRRPQLEQQMGIKGFENQVITKSAGQASHVVSAVYENGTSPSGGAQVQSIWFVGGKLAGVAPGSFTSTFRQQFPGARVVAAGQLGGSAACAHTSSASASNVALCTWADNDTFGILISPTMTVAQLAAEIPAVRAAIEHVVK